MQRPRRRIMHGVAKEAGVAGVGYVLCQGYSMGLGNWLVST